MNWNDERNMKLGPEKRRLHESRRSSRPNGMINERRKEDFWIERTMTLWMCERDKSRWIDNQGSTGMLLDPLAEIEIRMLMSVMIDGCKSMVNFQCDRKRQLAEQHDTKTSCQKRPTILSGLNRLIGGNHGQPTYQSTEALSMYCN